MTAQPGPKPAIEEFLLDRIREDERTAREELMLRDGSPDNGTARSMFLRRFTPNRLLREVGAKRLTIDEHQPWLQHGFRWTCSTCYDGDDGLDPVSLYPCPTLRLLALPYTDHPEYDERWDWRNE